MWCEAGQHNKTSNRYFYCDTITGLAEEEVWK